MEIYTFWYFFIILIILLFIIFRILFCSENNTPQTKKINRKNLQTGDLLFVRYDNILGYFMRFWSLSPWTHVAMVYRSPIDKLYIMETANYRNKKGVLFLDFDDWLKLNKNCTIAGMQMKCPDNFDKDVLLNNFKSLSSKNLDTFGTNWVRLLYNHPYKSLNNQENITCYELINYLLQESNIMKKNLSPSSYFPSDIVNHNIPINKGFYFDILSLLKRN